MLYKQNKPVRLVKELSGIMDELLFRPNRIKEPKLATLPPNHEKTTILRENRSIFSIQKSHGFLVLGFGF